MSESGISTVPRFLFLNTYAILLLFGGIGFVSMPFIHFNWWTCALCAAAGLFCWSHSIRIFRNTPQLIPSSFRDCLQAPCGRLLVILVLKDLGQGGEYRRLLKRFREPLPGRLRESCRRQRTVVKIY